MNFEIMITILVFGIIVGIVISFARLINGRKKVPEKHWKCPSCKENNDETIFKCLCGYKKQLLDNGENSTFDKEISDEENSLECPRCGLIKPVLAFKCDCDYEFNPLLDGDRSTTTTDTFRHKNDIIHYIVTHICIFVVTLFLVALISLIFNISPINRRSIEITIYITLISIFIHKEKLRFVVYKNLLGLLITAGIKTKSKTWIIFAIILNILGIVMAFIFNLSFKDFGTVIIICLLISFLIMIRRLRHVIKLHSELLAEDFFLVSNEKLKQKVESKNPGVVVYLRGEFKYLDGLKPETQNLIHLAKKVFGGKFIARNKVEESIFNNCVG